MSVYFVQLFKEILSIGILGGIFSFNLKIRNVLISFFIGFIYSYIAFYIAKEHLQLEKLYFLANAIVIIIFVLSFIFLIKRANFLKYILFILISFAYFARYFYISSSLPIFSTNFLDDMVIVSISLILLSFLFFITIFFVINFLKFYNKKLIFLFSFIFAIIWVNIALSCVLLYCERYGLINDFMSILQNKSIGSFLDKYLITYISKMELFFDKYYIYIVLFMLFVLCVNCFRKKIKNPTKKFLLDIEYRKNIYHNDKINRNVFFMVLVLLCALCLHLYYDMVESKPIELSPASTPVENNGYFIFDIAEFRDNDLHRYAYISPSGKRIRFFIINKFEDKDSPSVVFDACSICGDMGYVLKGKEVICVACGVRIFKPSIGKRSGCNPIPVENVEIKDGKIYVLVSEIVAGETYFSEKVDVEVKDPVDGSVFLSSDAYDSTIYNGLTYFFKNQKNYDLFKQNPATYVDDEQKGYFIISNHNKGVEDDW